MKVKKPESLIDSVLALMSTLPAVPSQKAQKEAAAYLVGKKDMRAAVRIGPENDRLFFRLLCVLSKDIGEFDAAAYMKLHGYLFDGIRPDAGKLRTVAAELDGSSFADCSLIGGSLKRLLSKLADLGECSKEEFTMQLTYYFSEIYLLCPFRHGSVLVLGTFFALLAEKYGYRLDYSGCGGTRLVEALKRAFLTDEKTDLYVCLTEAVGYAGIESGGEEIEVVDATQIKRELRRDVRLKTLVKKSAKPKKEDKKPAGSLKKDVKPRAEKPKKEPRAVKEKPRPPVKEQSERLKKVRPEPVRKAAERMPATISAETEAAKAEIAAQMLAAKEAIAAEAAAARAAIEAEKAAARAEMEAKARKAEAERLHAEEPAAPAAALTAELSVETKPAKKSKPYSDRSSRGKNSLKKALARTVLLFEDLPEFGEFTPIPPQKDNPLLLPSAVTSYDEGNDTEKETNAAAETKAEEKSDTPALPKLAPLKKIERGVQKDEDKVPALPAPKEKPSRKDTSAVKEITESDEDKLARNIADMSGLPSSVLKKAALIKEQIEQLQQELKEVLSTKKDSRN